MGGKRWREGERRGEEKVRGYERASLMADGGKKAQG